MVLELLKRRWKTDLAALGLVALASGAFITVYKTVQSVAADNANPINRQNLPTNFVYANDNHLNNIWAWDVDGDGSVDEAVKASGYYPGAFQPLPLNVDDDAFVFEHLVAPGTDPARLLYSQPPARDMSAGERTALTGLYGMLNPQSGGQ